MLKLVTEKVRKIIKNHGLLKSKIIEIHWNYNGFVRNGSSGSIESSPEAFNACSVGEGSSFPKVLPLGEKQQQQQHMHGYRQTIARRSRSRITKT